MSAKFGHKTFPLVYKEIFTQLIKTKYEILQSRFCKRVLGITRTASNAACSEFIY